MIWPMAPNHPAAPVSRLRRPPVSETTVRRLAELPLGSLALGYG